MGLFLSSTGLTHAVAVDHHQFIGCLRSLKYRELIDVTWEVSPTIVMQATPGCQDLCQGENPCGEGRCVNLYTSVHCDCSLLDREGDKCQYSSKFMNRYHFSGFFGDFDLSDLVDHIYKYCFKKFGKCRYWELTYSHPLSLGGEILVLQFGISTIFLSLPFIAKSFYFTFKGIDTFLPLLVMESI